MSIKTFMGNNSDALLQLGAGLLGGRTASEQLGLGVSGFAQARRDGKARNATMEWLRANNPDIGSLLETGAISPTDAVKMAWEQRNRSEKPQNPFMSAGGSLYNWQTGEWVQPPGGAGGKVDEFTQRQQAAQQFGLTPDSPAYQSFVLTGKMPREDQAPLTATDKKAILDADEAVQANEQAITALSQAEQINSKANAGVTAGTRAVIGNNLPDWLVPDAISSPESSAATTEYDNLVMGSALSSLKSIFGGNPTEGERAILLDLQASSSKPPEVRAGILRRAKEAAAKRLEFNRQRANELRGGSYYKPSGGQGNAGKTSSGISFTVEP